MTVKEGIAIVGMAGRFPGARDVDALWECVVANRSAARDITDAEWGVRGKDVMGDASRLAPDRTVSRRACRLDDFDLGDVGDLLPADLLPRLSRLSRLTLRVGLDAARSLRSPLDPGRTSVILANVLLPTDGASRLSEELFFGRSEQTAAPLSGDDIEPMDAFPAAIPAGLLARALGAKGGSFTLDAACASSLYAMHLARLELLAGRIDAVVCGGVALPHSLYVQIGFSQLKALSPSGRCTPYAATADGLVTGEGAAMVVLKRESDARRDGDAVLGVIRGIGLSNDVGGSLLSPASEGQLRAMRAAYEDAGWDPADVDLVEGHGTGTARGDAVEVESLRALWQGRAGRCVLGSVKGNVGHLLTAAGTAALCKVLRALDSSTLPPSFGGDAPAEALGDGPFRLLAGPEPWRRRAEGVPRRAAISGFGFGGINAHLLIEEAPGAEARPVTSSVRSESPPIALVGLAAHVGRADSLESFRRAVLSGTPIDDPRPRDRWLGLDRARSVHDARLGALRGAWVSDVALPAGRYRIPPSDVPSMLAQQTLMLAVAGEAMDDARHPGPGPHARVGVVVGLGLALESTSFGVRWSARARVEAWAEALGLRLDDDELDDWATGVRDAVASPLDAQSTLGALGGMVASRIAREFQLGGPSFAVASDQASGLRALEVAARLLQAGDADAMLVGAVDLAGDVRSVLASHALRPFSGALSTPFDGRADGVRLGEGAVAVVAKRLADAERAGDRVYAVLRGVGASSAGALASPVEREHAYVRSAGLALREAAVAPGRIGLVQAHGSGDPEEDAIEARSLAAAYPASNSPGATALASTSACVGEAGAAASLASVVTAALCLHHEVLPPLGPLVSATSAIDWSRTSFHLPRAPEAWLRDRADGPRLAAVATMGFDGSCLHAILAGQEGYSAKPAVAALGDRSAALFLLREGEAEAELRALATCHPGSLESLAALWHRRGTSGSVSRAIVASSVDELVRELDRSVRKVAPTEGSLAFVFPGSGAQFVGMGRDLALAMPGVYRQIDAEFERLASHLQLPWVSPRRTSWGPGWEDDAYRHLLANPERAIVAQVAHGAAVHDALRQVVKVTDASYIGYSLGESTALFAARVWRDRDVMFDRTLAAPLFRTDLAGPMRVVEEAWGQSATWRAALLRRPQHEIREALMGTAAILIVNTPGECVVGGDAVDVDATAAKLGCVAVTLEGVPSVHLPLVQARANEYRAHHVLRAAAPAGVRVYGAASAAPLAPSPDAIADAIVESGLRGFDFARVIERAWADGVRVFLEVGPQASCSRMIGRILEGRPHVAVSACDRGVDGYRAVLAAVARVAEAGVPVDLDALYAEHGAATGARPLRAQLPAVALGGDRPPISLRPPRPPQLEPPPLGPATSGTRHRDPPLHRPLSRSVASFFDTAQATVSAHEEFLRTAHDAFVLNVELLRRGGLQTAPVAPSPPRFDRGACLEFAVGSIARVLGPAFDDVDRHPTRVRLPDEPLMLVDRVLSVEGAEGEPGPGRVVTEHDVLDNAWYLDGGRAPVCISVEAGQADLFLSAYLGIDRHTLGLRVYRLLDATIVFHRDLPVAGERVRYDIRIDRFLRQGDTWLFFFRFDGTIGGEPFITMSDGCAGFFSDEQLSGGRGIASDACIPRRAARGAPFEALVPHARMALSDEALDAIRAGDLARAFGPPFESTALSPSMRLPGGRMRLVHRVVSLDTSGGPLGLGEILGEADVSPGDWYLVCHFIDDQVMPGTLMYECCLHTLRVLLLRIGWVASGEREAHYAPVPGVAGKLRCRGQVTAQTRTVRYRVTIQELGYGPEPYAIASASMFADDRHVVQMEGMSIMLRGVSRDDLESHWAAYARPRFDRRQVVAYAEGNPSECFGERYLPFDRERRLARLPRDPYLFLDRVRSVEQPPWVLEPGGWVTCEVDVPRDAWYFAAGGQGTMPFAVLLEVALQPCGWLAAYLGSALLSDVDLHFRNLDGSGTQLADVGPDVGTLTARARLTRASQAGGMILEEFDIEVRAQGRPVYTGHTGFGFFPTAALAAQVGIRGATPWARRAGSTVARHPRWGPASPTDFVGLEPPPGLALPGAALSMIDRIDDLDLEGGDAGLGSVRGTKTVDPDEWFFRAHFHEDPVMPGSLGLEALLELAKVFARARFPNLAGSHRFQAMASGRVHQWQYRGQVIPSNEEVVVEVRVTAVEPGAEPVVVFDGQLAVDGKVIYATKDFAFCLVREGGGAA